MQDARAPEEVEGGNAVSEDLISACAKRCAEFHRWHCEEVDDPGNDERFIHSQLMSWWSKRVDEARRLLVSDTDVISVVFSDDEIEFCARNRRWKAESRMTRCSALELVSSLEAEASYKRWYVFESSRNGLHPDEKKNARMHKEACVLESMAWKIRDAYVFSVRHSPDAPARRHAPAMDGAQYRLF